MKPAHTTLALASACALVLALGACSKKNEDQTVGQKLDSAVAQTGAAAASARTDAKEALQETREAVRETGEKMADKISDADLSALKINVDTRDGKVTLSGPAPSVGARERATTIARAVKGVSAVDNRLVVNAG